MAGKLFLKWESFFWFSKQTMQALIWTLRSQADLLDKLLMDNHKYILTARLQSDLIERRFSQYRQLNGGHFLVSLIEVETSENIFSCQTLLKENINFWEEELAVTNTTQEIEKIKEALDSMSVSIQEATLTAETEEVVLIVSAYIAKQLTEKTKCHQCINPLYGCEVEINSYFDILLRVGLKIPSAVLKDYVAFGFATLDLTDALLQQYCCNNIRKNAETVLNTYCPNILFTYADHIDCGQKWANKTMTNIFYNNKQNIENSKIRKDVVCTFKKRQRLSVELFVNCCIDRSLKP